MTSTYRVDLTYEKNYRLGPDYSGPFPEVPSTQATELFGLPVRSRIGVAAGLLLNAKWIECYARLGFDLLTYKTVRSSHRPCYPPPNWVRIDSAETLTGDPELPLLTIEPTVTQGAEVTWAVCFGMPSMAPEVWRPDVEQAKRSLGDGQLLNVSVVGTPSPSEDGDLESLADDFARCASWAKESGADLLEANFSCPNVCSAEGQIYQDPKTARFVAQRIRQSIGSGPLLIKAGNFPDPDRMTQFLSSMNGVADAIVMVNGIQRRVHRPDGSLAFAEHERVGIIGRAIHDQSVRIVAEAVDVVRREKLDLCIFGVGGIFTPDDADDFLSAGAEATFLGGSPMTNPTIAIQIKESQQVERNDQPSSKPRKEGAEERQ